MKPLIAAAACLLIAASFTSTASAADVVSPRDGETIGSQPQFVFDFADGSAEVELSKAADVKAGGSDPGAFVETTHTNFLLIGPEQYPASVAGPWGTSKLSAGRHFWHAKATNYDAEDPFTSATWGPTRAITVRDEPAVLEGWTLRAQRGRARSGCARVLLQGTVAWSDNAADPTVRYSLNVKANGRTVKRFTGTFESFERRFSHVACTRARQLKVTMTLRDAQHVTVGPARALSTR